MEQANELKIEIATTRDCSKLAIMNRQLINEGQQSNTMTVLELESRMCDWFQKGVYTGYLFKFNDETIGYALVDTSEMYVGTFLFAMNIGGRGMGERQ